MLLNLVKLKHVSLNVLIALGYWPKQNSSSGMIHIQYMFRCQILTIWRCTMSCRLMLLRISHRGQYSLYCCQVCNWSVCHCCHPEDAAHVNIDLLLLLKKGAFFSFVTNTVEYSIIQKKNCLNVTCSQMSLQVFANLQVTKLVSLKRGQETRLCRSWREMMSQVQLTLDVLRIMRFN